MDRPMKLIPMDEFRRRYREQKRPRRSNKAASMKSAVLARAKLNRRIDRTLDMLAQGMTKDQIAEEIGVHRTTINYYLRRAKER